MATRRFVRFAGRLDARLLVGLLLTAVATSAAWKYFAPQPVPKAADRLKELNCEPRRPLDIGGFKAVTTFLPPWGEQATLADVSAAWHRVGYRTIDDLDRQLAGRMLTVQEQLPVLFLKAMLYNYEGEPQRACDVMNHLRKLVETDDAAAREALYSIVFF